MHFSCLKSLTKPFYFSSIISLRLLLCIVGICIVFVCQTTNLQAQTTIVSHNFNVTAEGWTPDLGTNGDWELGASVLNGGSDGSNYWYSTPSNYNASADLILNSPVYTTEFASASNMTLSVDIRYNTTEEYDGFRIEYNPDGGATWYALGAVGSGYNWYNDTDVSAFADVEGWSGDNQVWQKAVIALPAALENNSNVQFRVIFKSLTATGEGVAFDNFIVTSEGAEILVSGNDKEIINGDTTPSEDDDTKFAKTDVTSGTRLKTFTIVNVYGGTLTLNGGTPVTIGGANAADFSVSQPGVGALNAAETTTFGILFNPSAIGTRFATVTISNTDADEGSYTFSIQGEGVNAVNIDDFDASDNSWVPGAASNGNVWTRGTNVYSTGANGSYWYTSPSDYNSGSTIQITRDIDLSAASDMILYVDLRFNTEYAYDGMKMEFNDGGGWADLGTIDGGINCYNNSVVALSTDGWTGHNERWKTAEIALPSALDNNASAQFRMTFSSDGAPNDVGVAFDNFMIATGIPDMVVEGNGIEITSGYVYTSYLAGTDFRNVDITSGIKKKTFVISNRGGGTLNLTGGVPLVTIGGTNSADFTVSTQPSVSSLGFLEETSFTIDFNPSALGTRLATVSIANDDADENPYTFAIGGTGDDAIVYHDFNASDMNWVETSFVDGHWLRGSAILSSGADGSYWYSDPTIYANPASFTLTSEAFDLSSYSQMLLSLDIRYDTQQNQDGFKIEYSDDNGTSWYSLGKHLDEFNWYNDTDVDGLADGVDGWSGDNMYWQTVEYDLPVALESATQAMFRISFGKLASTSGVGAAFDNFTIYNGTIELPVELSRFYGQQLGSQIVLAWETKSELNNDYFEIQKSIDGKYFKTIGKVDGAGTSNHSLKYEMIDKKPTNGSNYYRLKQVDFDGQEEIHETIKVNYTDKQLTFDMHIFPNPSGINEGAYLKVNTPDLISPISIRVFNISGQFISQNEFIEINNGDVDLTAIIPSRSGVYLIFVSQGKYSMTKRLIKY